MCGTLLLAKVRNTMARASALRICPRNSALNPSCFSLCDWDACPIPATSTNSTVVGVTFFGLNMSASGWRRGSGTWTTAIFACTVLVAYPLMGAPAFVNALKSVVLPLCGRPMIPIVRDIFMYSFSTFYLKVSLWCLFYYFLLSVARL